MRRIWAAFVVMAVLVGACGDDDDDSAATTTTAGETSESTTTEVADLGTLRIASVPASSFGPLILALEWGLFEERGLTVEWTSLSQPADTIAAMVSGSVDLIGTGVEQTAVINQQNPQLELRNISASLGASAFAVISRPGIGVELGDFSTLRGKRIGTFGAPRPADTVIRALLTEAGLDPDSDVELIETPIGPAQIQAWESNAFDVTIAGEPIPTVLIDRGSAEMFADLRVGGYGALSDIAQSAYAAPRAEIESNRAAYEAFVEAICAADERANEDVEASAQLVAELLAGAGGGGTETAVVARGIEHDVPNWKPVIGEDALTEWLGLTAQAGLLNSVPTYDQVVDASFEDLWEC